MMVEIMFVSSIYETTGGGLDTILEDDCELEWTWGDDGNFSIYLTIIDEESDQSSTVASIIVLNRPPEIVLVANYDTIPVLSEVTFEITERNDPDTQTPNSPVDILWNNTSCKEGQIGVKCTVTAVAEGGFRWCIGYRLMMVKQYMKHIPLKSLI